MERSRVELSLATLLMLSASTLVCVAQSAAVSGVVRDASGVAQLGVLVQVMAADSAVVGRAFTDLRGHYLVSNLTAGSYQVQASAALFVPVRKPTLWLRPRRALYRQPDDEHDL